VSDEQEQVIEATERLKRELMPATDRPALAAAIFEFIQQLAGEAVFAGAGCDRARGLSK